MVSGIGSISAKKKRDRDRDGPHSSASLPVFVTTSGRSSRWPSVYSARHDRSDRYRHRIDIDIGSVGFDETNTGIGSLLEEVDGGIPSLTSRAACFTPLSLFLFFFSSFLLAERQRVAEGTLRTQAAAGRV